MMNKINLTQIKGDLQGGFGGGILNLLQCIPLGMIAFAPLGDDYRNAGIIACIIGSVLAGFFSSIFGGSPGQITAPSPAISVVFSAIIIQIMNSHFFSQFSGDYFSNILLLSFFTVFLSGFIQILFGLFRADYLIKFISYPVIAGIITGAGLLIIYESLLKLFHAENIHELKYGYIIIGITTAALLTYRRFLIKGMFSFPAKIAIGIGLYYLLQFFGFSSDSLGGTFGKFTFIMPTFETLTSSIKLAGDQNLHSYIYLLVPIAINLAILSSLISLLTVLSMSSYIDKNPNSRQELIGQGIGNMISGGFGGLPSSILYNRSLFNIQEGGKTKLSGIINSLTTLLLAYFFASYIEYLPKAVITGIVLYLGLNSIDKWSVQLFYNVISGKVALSKEVLVDIGIILAVIALIFSGNFIIAISVGIIISVIFFLSKMREVLIKRVYEDKSIPTKKIDDDQVMEFFTKHHQDIKVIELSGVMYFGSAEKLQQEVKNLAENGVQYIILDMKKVDDIDLTGARVLEMIYVNLQKQRKLMGFSYLDKESRIWPFLENMRFFEKVDRSHIFIDNDRALQYFEAILLKDFKQEQDNVEINLSEIPVFKGLTKEELAIIKNSLNKESYKEGETIFKQGDSADSMFFIAKGSVDIEIAIGDKRLAHTKRIQSLSKGAFFGEMALFQKGVRSATVIASSNLICYRLSFVQYRELVEGYSHLSVSLISNISKNLSKRLQFVNQMISEM